MKTTIAIIALTAASPLAAQQFSMPNGCEAYLTIQSASCQVSHYFKCTEDDNGEQRRATLDEEGMSYIGRINAQAEWLESFHLRSGHTERLSETVDPMNVGELIANGVDTWDFSTDSAEIGVSRYEGMDRLTGENVEIDGITLLGTEYALTAYDGDGNVAWRSEGREFVSPEWNMFIGGESSYITTDDRFDSDDTPVEFIFPDEAGFLSVNPKFGCGVEMSSLDAPTPIATQIQF